MYKIKVQQVISRNNIISLKVIEKQKYEEESITINK